LGERVDRVLSSPRHGVELIVETLGERPAGRIDADSTIVRLAIDVLRELDVSATGDASSTDANIPISMGIPAICVGLTTGGNVHRTDEFIDTQPLGAGLVQLVALVVGIADGVANGSI